jgi:putative oxidoreductase
MGERAKELGWAAAILRASVGIIFLFHGVQMLFGDPGFNVTASRVADLGFRPPTLFAAVFGGMVGFSGLFLFIGLFTRPAAIPATVSSALAIFWPAWSRLVFETHEKFPYGLLLAAVALSVYFLGPGFVSVDRKIARERADARGA